MSEKKTFSQRLVLLRNKRYDEWWFIVFGGPIGTLFAALVADIRWITPNRLTCVGFAIRVAGAICLTLNTSAADLAAVAMLQLSIVMDIMDGSIARYRKQPSAVGAFLDKITDGVGLTVVGTCLGLRSYEVTGEPWMLVGGMTIGATFLARCYMYWVVAYFQKERGVVATVGPDKQRPFGELTFPQRLAYYLRSTPKIFEVGESDLYFWISLFLLTGHIEKLTLPLAGIMAVWFCLFFGVRLSAMMALDRDRG